MKRATQVVIDISSDEESIKEEPDVKHPRRDSESFTSHSFQPVAPQEVHELRQRVAKYDIDYKRAVKLAGQFQERVEFLEGLIDKKSDGQGNKSMEELQKKLVDAQASAQAARADANNQCRINSELTRENERLEQELAAKRRSSETWKRLEEVKSMAANREEELQKKLDETLALMKEARREAVDRENQLKKKLDETSLLMEETRKEAASREEKLKDTLEQTSAYWKEARKEAAKKEEQLKEKITTLSNLMEEEKSCASEQQKRDKERIYELMRKVAELEKQQQQELPPPKPAARRSDPGVSMKKLFAPIQEYPGYNFVRRIQGAQGNTLKNLEKSSECRITLRGKGSMDDESKEAANRGKPYWEHLDEQLHVLIKFEGAGTRAEYKLDKAAKWVADLLVPPLGYGKDPERKKALETAIINGTYRPRIALLSPGLILQPHLG